MILSGKCFKIASAAAVSGALACGFAGCAPVPGEPGGAGPQIRQEADAGQAVDPGSGAVAGEESESDDSGGGEADGAVDAVSAAADKVSGMTTAEKVAQLFIVDPESLSDSPLDVTGASQIADGVARRPVAGICWFKKNLQDAGQIRDMLAGGDAAAESRIGLPMIDAVDEEGGPVVRVAANPALCDELGIDRGPGARELGAGGAAAARSDAARIGSYLYDLGFDADFAPVCDIAPDEGDPMHGRSFGDDAGPVGDCAAAQIEAFAEAGVLSCAKHFPGLGGAAGGDSHDGAVESALEGDALDRSLEPFGRAISAGADMVMVSHAVCSGIDPDRPASLSPEVIGGLLRGRLGYDGLVVTDSMQMGAVTDGYDAGEAAVMAIEAGADIVLLPEDFDEAYGAVAAAVESGRISGERLDESARRIVETRMALQAGRPEIR